MKIPHDSLRAKLEKDIPHHRSEFDGPPVHPQGRCDCGGGWTGLGGSVHLPNCKEDPVFSTRFLKSTFDRHPNSARFHELLEKAGEMHDRKQSDYGRGDDPFANVRASDEWGIPGWIGAMVRAQDKLRRLQTHAIRGTLVNESVEDSLLDLAVYALIALVLYEEEQNGNKDGEGQ